MKPCLHRVRLRIMALALAGFAAPLQAQTPVDLPPMSPLFPPWARPVDIGPYNAQFPAGGDGLASRVPGYADNEKLVLGPVWTLHAWIKPQRTPKGPAIVVSVGTPGTSDMRALVLDGLSIGVKVGDHLTLAKAGAVDLDRWSLVVAISDGHSLRLIINGKQVASDVFEDKTNPTPDVNLAPRIPGQAVFAGRLADFRVAARVLSDRDIKALGKQAPNEDLMAFQTGSPPWPLSLRQQAGLYQPQPAWTLPKGKAAFSRPVVKPSVVQPVLVAKSDLLYDVNGWRLIEAPKITLGGEALSKPDVDTAKWYAATVPGTILTTLVDRGVYPDPTIGLNNMAIPERLSRQSYWYRTQFTAPAALGDRHIFLNFNGTNYAAEVWLNGTNLGSIKGAFIRGQFDVTDKLLAEQPNVVAVKITPPPHPGIPNEQSLTAGRGGNGGIMTIDGPTFVATEGWDWIPGIRDRNSGLWQGVQLQAVGDVRIGDPHFITTLPNHDTRLANLEIEVPVSNLSAQAVTAVVKVAFDDVAVEKTIDLAAGASGTVRFAPSAFAQLSIKNPKLWWPNGYGEPTLHQAKITTRLGGKVADSRDVRFGLRQVTYEISLMDQAGDLRRVGLDLTKAHALGQSVVDERHEHIRKVPGGWAASLKPEAETSPAVTEIEGDAAMAPHLLIRVNGVRIAARGGNIGMDDLMKRVDRARLEPYFRLHKEAHLNIIRNWVGQNTEENFYDLADEYGLMVLNDFWESTTNSNVEIEDVVLFLDNARDTVRRFRNHPSIVLWFGRNEGVPQPILNEALQTLIEREDGTRLYMGASNDINLAGSGPYNWREPEGYFTEYARGFAVELGTPSFPTLEAWKRAVPAEDLWPINDTWAYHDWHQDRGSSVKTFMEAMETRFGAGKSLEDFERKAQMLEYESYRAIFEGFNAGLWKTNSARMLWMTGPAWPSAHWQMFSSDLDTHGAFYGVKKASEPFHVQMNLPDFKVIVVNNTQMSLANVSVRARVFGLNQALREDKQVTLTAAGGGVTDALTLDLAADMQKGPVLVQLEARDATGQVLSSNSYWQARDPRELKALDDLPQVAVKAMVTSQKVADETVLQVTLSNPASTPALMIKLGVFSQTGLQILPAYFSDNYVSLMPGETRTLSIRFAQSLKAAEIKLRGWNIAPSRAPIKGQ
jgi:hypothetical protein